MVRFLLISATFAASVFAGTATLAQQSECQTYEVTARLLNVRSEPSVFGRILDVLAQDQIVCVSQVETSSGQQWGNVLHKSDPGADGEQPVNGWASMKFLTEVTAAAPTEAPQNRAGSETAQPNTGQTETGETNAPVATLSPGNAVLTFTDPVPYGPFPVQGRSLEQLASGIPLFAPFDGLPEDRWRNNCSTCHKWNAARLCQQGQGYAANPASTLRIQHPYGGPYKKTLGDWAAAGCN